MNRFPHLKHCNIFRDDDLINPVKDLSEKAGQLKGFVTIKDEDNDRYFPPHCVIFGQSKGGISKVVLGFFVVRR